MVNYIFAQRKAFYKKQSELFPKDSASKIISYMLTLSLMQPWASLIVMGIKTIETRRWQTGHRGLVLIHASQRKAGAIIAAEPPIAKYIPDFNKLPFGCIIGQAMLTDIVLIQNLHLSKNDIACQSLELNAFGHETLNRYAWLLEEAIAFAQPIPARGHLHLWEYTGISF